MPALRTGDFLAEGSARSRRSAHGKLGRANEHVGPAAGVDRPQHATGSAASTELDPTGQIAARLKGEWPVAERAAASWLEEIWRQL
jgi:hypothetical protein